MEGNTPNGTFQAEHSPPSDTANDKCKSCTPRKGDTAQWIADKDGVSRRKVFYDALFARNVDTIVKRIGFNGRNAFMRSKVKIPKNRLADVAYALPCLDEADQPQTIDEAVQILHATYTDLKDGTPHYQIKLPKDDHVAAAEKLLSVVGADYAAHVAVAIARAINLIDDTEEEGADD